MDIIVSTDAFTESAVSWLGSRVYELVVDAGVEKADVGIAAKELVGGSSPDKDSPEAIKISVLVMKIVTGGSVKRVVGYKSEEPAPVLSAVVVR